MALPKYDKSKRKKSFSLLPKGAYVIKIIDAIEAKNKKGNGTHIKIMFDIAEGPYMNFYTDIAKNSTNEDKKWSNDAFYYLTVPTDASQPFVWDNWNTFFADLEDSNDGFVFGGDVKTLRNKVIGGKFHNEQSEYEGNIYDHTKLKWTCVADDVRNGNPGQMPKDKLVNVITPTNEMTTDADGFAQLPTDLDEENVPPWMR